MALFQTKTPEIRFLPGQSVFRISRILRDAYAGTSKYLLTTLVFAHLPKAQTTSPNSNQWDAQSRCEGGEQIQLDGQVTLSGLGDTQTCESLCRQHINDWNQDYCCWYWYDQQWQCRLYRNGGSQSSYNNYKYQSIQLKESLQKNAWYPFKSCQGTLSTSFTYDDSGDGPSNCHIKAIAHYDQLSDEDKNKKWCLNYDTTQKVCQFIEGSVESTWTQSKDDKAMEIISKYEWNQDFGQGDWESGTREECWFKCLDYIEFNLTWSDEHCCRYSFEKYCYLVSSTQVLLANSDYYQAIFMSANYQPFDYDLHCGDYQFKVFWDNTQCVRGSCAQERYKLEADGTCTPCNAYEITDPSDNSKCVIGSCNQRAKLEVDGSCTPCGPYEITDPIDNTKCVIGSCNQRAKLEVDGSCTPCEPYKILDPSDNTRCVRPNCLEGQSPTADGLCKNTSAILEEYNISPAPIFIDHPDLIKILVNPLEQDKEYSMNVGEYVDLNTNLPEEITIQVVSGLNDTFMTWDKTSKTIKFAGLGVDKIGNYTVKVQIENLAGKSSEAEFTFEIENEIQSEQHVQTDEQKAQIDPQIGLAFAKLIEERLAKEEEEMRRQRKEFQEMQRKIDEQKEPKQDAKIISFDYFGALLIKVKQSGFPIDVNLINESHLNIIVKPAQERFDDEGFDPSSLDFKWELQSNEDGLLKILVTWLKPYEVSQSATRDIIECQILISEEERLALSKSNRRPESANDEEESDDQGTLGPIDIKLQKFIKPQLENSQVMKNYETQVGYISKKATNFAVANYMILYSITSSLGSATLWIQQMQLTTHYQMLSLNYPAIVNLFNSYLFKVSTFLFYFIYQLIYLFYLFKVVNFDAIEPQYSTDLIFNYQESHTESYQERFDRMVPPQWQDLGYESNVLQQNSGSIFILIYLYIARVLVQYPLSKLICQCKSERLRCCRAYPKKLRMALFYHQIILIIMESYLTIMISAAINLQFYSNETWGEIIGFLTSAVLFTLSVVVIPIFQAYMSCQPYNQLLTLKGFRLNYGAFYESFRTESKWTMMASIVYVYRRLGLVLICYFLKSFKGCQIQAVCLLNLLCSVYYAKFLPMQKSFENLLLIFNEFINQLHCVTIMELTLNDPSTQIQYGWFFVGQVAFMSIVNIVVVGVVQLNECYRVAKKQFIEKGLEYGLLIEEEQNTEEIKQSSDIVDLEEVKESQSNDIVDLEEVKESQSNDIVDLEEVKESQFVELKVKKFIKQAAPEEAKNIEQAGNQKKQRFSNPSLEQIKSPRTIQQASMKQNSQQVDQFERLLDDIEKDFVPVKNQMTNREVRSYLDNRPKYDEATYQRVIRELRAKNATETQREVKQYLDDGLKYNQATNRKVKDELWYKNVYKVRDEMWAKAAEEQMKSYQADKKYSRVMNKKQIKQKNKKTKLEDIAEDEAEQQQSQREAYF